ncbi:N,N-dimethylformamidase beta subunit family domain-containing protein [Bradyrhizobium elkanii]|uniref:N,N-dimethylformamidase beta subunit family domain-containing protein n=1 Tax=Bradyrhizobium elkanii TaxID=29448 RepID=UPI001BAAAF50|nr:N,N-dimethylformamidase beta subunit family domain-containing protein [Bradyrhizobium elkanii]MBR1165108.1 LamG domain-containing protein [Bradyrhizobium elkanii]
MAQVKLFGYSDKISVKPGEVIQFYVNADGTEIAEAQLVRLIHGDQHPAGPGHVEQEIECPVNGHWRVEKQYTQVGSFLEAADTERRLALEGSFTVFAFVHPLWPQVGVRQCLLGRWDNDKNCGFGLGIKQNGLLEFWVGQGDEVDYLEAEVPLKANMWYFVAASLDANTGRATLYQEGVVNRYNSVLGKVAPLDLSSHVSEIFRFRPKHLADTPFLMAGSRDWHEKRGHFVSQLYCGKIDRPGLFDRVLGRDELDLIRSGHRPPAKGMLAYWDTTHGYTDQGIGDTVTDVGPFNLHAKGYNRPVRAQTGWNWSGRNDCFRLAPDEYGGVEFHSDALIDCNWKQTKALKLPDNLRSGAYAVRLRAGPGTGLGEEYIPFFVRPKVPTGRIAFLVPTASYLAYANEHLSFDAPIVQGMTGMTPILTDIDVEMYKNPEFGHGCYDSWADGQGVCYSSYRRPVINMRPKYRISSMDITWQYPADLSVIAWLEHHNYDYDVLTDEDLDLEGVAALEPYRCVISGTHPEYYSERMMDATEDYIEGGGRYIYLGANGYYCNVAIRKEEPWVLECRKFGDTWKAWEARPGEHYMATTGQKGGPWKCLGRPPQKIMGVGFVSEGFGRSEPFYRMPDSYDSSLSWITEGIEGEIIGDFGLAYDGAAGVELDRYDLTLGTPPNAKVIASSGGHTDNYITHVQVQLHQHPGITGSYDYRVRADMTYFATPNDGAVFSCSSIAFGQALPVNGFENNVSRLLANVVNAFAKPGPLPDAARPEVTSPEAEPAAS